MKHDSIDLNLDADPRQIAAYLGDQQATIRDAWGQLVLEHAQIDERQLASAMDAFLTGLTAFVAHPHPHVATNAAGAWKQSVPANVEGISTTAAAMALLGEVLRGALTDPADPTGSEARVGVVCSLLPDFSAEFVRGLMMTANLSRSEEHWYEVSRQLTEERERRMTHLAILNEVATALSSTLSLNDLYRIIYEQCGRLVDTSNFYIATIGPAEDEMTLATYYANGSHLPDRSGRVVKVGLTSTVLAQGEPVFFNDYAEACRARGFGPIPGIDLSRPVAWLGAPIISGNRTIGILAVMTSRGTFDDVDAETLSAVARQAGAAIANARLYAAQLTQANQLRAINQLSHTMASIREPQRLMDRSCERIQELFGYSVVSIFAAHPDNNQLVLRTIHGSPDSARMTGLSLTIGGPGMVSLAATSHQPVVSNDVLADPRYLPDKNINDIRSELSIPLLREETLLGVLDVQSPRADAFTQQDIDLLETVADQLAIALENADLFTMEQKRRTELALILEASQAANSSLVLDDVIQRVAEGIADAIGLPSCVVYLNDEEGNRLLPSAYVARAGSLIDTERVGQVIPSTETSQLLRRIYLSGHEASVIEMMSCDVDDDLSRVLCPSAVLAVPFVAKQQFLGLAVLVSHDDEYHFSPHQLRIAYGIAGAAALALENARLYTRSHTLGMAEERIRVAREIHDGIAQGLTAIALNLEAADHMFRAKPEKAREKIERALQLSRENLENARRSVLDLHASALQELSLAEAIQRRTQQFVHDHHERAITGSFNGDSMHGRLSSRMELSLYRIFEEALDNIARHSGATHVEVTLERNGDDVLLTISDNGAGFDVDTVMSGHQPGGRFGLVAVRERVRLLHGTLTVQAGDGAGTRLRVAVPFESPHGVEETAEAVPFKISALSSEDGSY
ncbi:MAG TPA: GAF domain-containing protein [Thermomicrobiales bacterium]|nr:GAF domain-containing protein [Thermomicrobiales bacterium]